MTHHLTVRQVAALVHHAPSTVRTWIRQGELPAQRVRDGYRVRLLDLHALLDRPSATEGARARTRLDTRTTGGRYAGCDANDDEATSHHPEEAMPDLSQYLSLTAAAERIGRSTRTVRRWIRCGDLPHAVQLKGRLLIHPDDLDAMVKPANAEAYQAASTAA